MREIPYDPTSSEADCECPLYADWSGTETQQPDAAGSVLWGLGAHEVRWTSALRRPERSGDFPKQAENRFRVTKALLAEDLQLMRSRHFLFTLKACCAIMSIEFFDGLETT